MTLAWSKGPPFALRLPTTQAAADLAMQRKRGSEWVRDTEEILKVEMAE